MNSKFAQEQTVKIYYSNKDVEKYNDSDMQEFHVKAGESNSRFELSNVDKITYLKFSFDRNVGITELSNIKILGKETYSLSNLAKIIPEQIDNFEIRGNSLIISSSSVNPSIRYSDKVNVVCPKCNKPTRIKYEMDKDKKVRVCQKCGAKLK